MDVEGIDEAYNACSRLNASASGSSGDGARPVSKSSRSVVRSVLGPQSLMAAREE